MKVVDVPRLLLGSVDQGGGGGRRAEVYRYRVNPTVDRFADILFPSPDDQFSFDCQTWFSNSVGGSSGVRSVRVAIPPGVKDVFHTARQAVQMAAVQTVSVSGSVVRERLFGRLRWAGQVQPGARYFFPTEGIPTGSGFAFDSLTYDALGMNQVLQTFAVGAQSPMDVSRFGGFELVFSTLPAGLYGNMGLGADPLGADTGNQASFKVFVRSVTSQDADVGQGVFGAEHLSAEMVNGGSGVQLRCGRSEPLVSVKSAASGGLYESSPLAPVFAQFGISVTSAAAAWFDCFVDVFGWY